MRKLGILLLTVCLATVLSFAQTSTKSTDKKATTSKGMSKTDTAKADTAKPATTGKTAPAGKMDINSASASDLEKLPGIGPATSAKIVAGRPYKTKRDLLTKKIVSQSEYDKISDNIIAHQDTGMAADKSDKKATTTTKKK
jgi:DNA uptake protein ComE-like DNA-binding protein